ncbi:hypothetical protein NVP1031O_007 [Vibrio phage 1.031.O._10N.261.46.F8]|nr:hypothetical protein NVP1031O_007 [Vibrio phage 1.031.O._10N.261.46.F8]
MSKSKLSHPEMPTTVRTMGDTYEKFSQCWCDWDGPSSWTLYRHDDEILAVAKDHDDSDTYVVASYDENALTAPVGTDAHGDELVFAMFNQRDEYDRATLSNGNTVDFGFEYDLGDLAI